MKDKYHMTVEQNIFVAKRNIIDYIWKSANLEGISVTYPQTEAIFNNMQVQGLKVSDAIAINNLKHAWGFVIDNINDPIDYSFICKINQIVGGENLIFNAGQIRKLPVAMGGTSWKPDIPNEQEVREEIQEIQELPDATDKAMTLMLYCMRKQIFLDGNKRTSMLAANQVMIANGAGIITVPLELQPRFRELLITFYETNDPDRIKEFIYDQCIDGIPFENSIEEPEIGFNNNDLEL